MPDVTSYQFPDADADSQHRYIEQQMAQAAKAKRISQGDRSVERHSIPDLIRLHDFYTQLKNRRTRMRTVLSRHGRQ